MKQWIDDGPKRAKGVTLERFVDVSESDIEEYCIIYTETMNQQPFGELEGRARQTPESRRLSEERIRKREGKWTTLISREKDGPISGLTEIIFFPDKPTMLYQDLTGVKEEYRGRGLGKWLKASMLYLFFMLGELSIGIVSTCPWGNGCESLTFKMRKRCSPLAVRFTCPSSKGSTSVIRAVHPTV